MTRTPGFLSDLVTRLICEIDNIHELARPLVYESAVLDRVVIVPKGFRTDFASVPRLPGAFLAFGGKGNRASVVHDFLYSGGVKVTREQADAVFAEALRASGYGALTVWLMHAGVRLGGASHFAEPNVPQPLHVAEQMEAP